MNELPVACTLSAEELRTGRAGLLPGLIASASEHHLAGDALSLRFEAHPGILERIAAVIERERQCCAFLRFELVVPPVGGPMRLEVSGPPGTAELLAALVRDAADATHPA